MPVHLKSLCCVLLVLATGARGSLAQEPTKPARTPLSLELRQLTMATRSEGPILVGLVLVFRPQGLFGTRTA